MTTKYAGVLWVGRGQGSPSRLRSEPQPGRRLFDAVLPQDEARLWELFTRLAGQGPVLVVVDQPNTIGALPVAVARATGLGVAYLPGLAMRRIADLHRGTAKTDARDA